MKLYHSANLNPDLPVAILFAVFKAILYSELLAEENTKDNFVSPDKDIKGISTSLDAWSNLLQKDR